MPARAERAGQRRRCRAPTVGRNVVHHMAHKHGLDPESAAGVSRTWAWTWARRCSRWRGAWASTRKRSAARAGDDGRDGGAHAAADVQVRATARARERGWTGTSFRKARGAVLAEGHVRRAGSLSRCCATRRRRPARWARRGGARANARLARVSAVPRAIPEPEHLASDTLRNAVRSPMARLIALQAEHGSMTDRFSSFIERFNSLRDRWNELNNRRHERARELSEARSRRLSEMPVHPELYDALERRRPSARRRLAELDDAAPRTGVLELPESHALSWLHDIVDWRAIGASASHLFDVEQRRVHARDQGYSVEEAVRLHPTGWSWFDNPDYAHSTAIGVRT